MPHLASTKLETRGQGSKSNLISAHDVNRKENFAKNVAASNYRRRYDAAADSRVPQELKRSMK